MDLDTGLGQGNQTIAQISLRNIKAQSGVKLFLIILKQLRLALILCQIIINQRELYIQNKYIEIRLIGFFST